MTREEARKAAEVMLAYANGEEIERYDDFKSEWEEVTNCTFDWFTYDYRVKLKRKFDLKTLQPFDKVLVRDDFSNQWRPGFYSYYDTTKDKYPIITIDGGLYSYVIPYNEETKHLVWTAKEAPEYYRYWED